MQLNSSEVYKINVSLNFEFKKFDLKLFNNLLHNHPYQRVMSYIIVFYDYNREGDVVKDFEYFKLLDRYYRYGITFRDRDLFSGEGISFNNKLFVRKVFYKNHYYFEILSNIYNIKYLLINDVKTIDLDDVDKGPITLSEVEKWKRKVVEQQKDKKSQLRLLDPNVYHSLITFAVFSKFEERPFNKIDYDLSWVEFGGVGRKLNYKDKYKHRKMYEDKIYNKIKDFLK